MNLNQIFAEKSFHRNDSQGKVAAHKVVQKVNFEYTDYIDKDEQLFRNVYSMAAVSNRLKGKASGVKGSSSNNPKPNEGEEEAAKKAQEESARRLAAGAKKLLAEEAQRDKREAVKQKNAEVVLDKIAELEKAIAQEAANPEQGIQDMKGLIEGKNQENEEVVGGGGQEKSPVPCILENPSSTSSSILTGGHVPIVEMGLILFTSSKQYDVAFLEDIHFDPKMKSITWRTEKTLRVWTQPPVTTVTERTVMSNIE